jgi:hypothetical protein
MTEKNGCDAVVNQSINAARQQTTIFLDDRLLFVQTRNVSGFFFSRVQATLVAQRKNFFQSFTVHTPSLLSELLRVREISSLVVIIFIFV